MAMHVLAFLKLNNLLKLVDYQSNEPYIFIYDNKLIEEYKIMIETINEKYITVDYLSLACEIPTLENKNEIAIKINPNKYSPKLDELEKYVNDCLRSVATIIKTEKRLEDRIAMLENRFELLEPESKFEEVF